MPLPELFAPFISRFEALGVAYFVTGSAAAIAFGEPRMTHDIDLVATLAPADAAAICEAFPLEHFYCPPEDIIRVELKRGHRGHFNLIDHGTGFKADVYLAHDALHRWAMARRVRVELGAGSMWLAPVEYVILRKLEYFREGQSQKHLRDIRAMLAASGADMDRAFIEAYVRQHHLDEAWQAAQ